MTLKETVVVEGKDDMAAVLRAVDANVICTSGYGISQETIELIRAAYESRGIIIFTDPDHAGGNIRKRLTALFPRALQAYLTRTQAEKAGDIGVENASAEAIRRALSAVGSEGEGSDFTMDDLIAAGLTGRADSAALRAEAGARLGIGSGNAAAFLRRLRLMGISREAFEKALGPAEK